MQVTQGQGPLGGQGACLRARTECAKAQEPGQAWRFQNMQVGRRKGTEVQDPRAVRGHVASGG